MKASAWESAVIAAPFFVLWLRQGNPAYLAVAGLWLAAGISMGERERKRNKKEENGQ